MSLRVLLYVRVSTREQADRWSPAAQRRALAEHAAAQGWTVVGRHEDLGISGATLAARPGMLALLDAVRSGAADIVCAVEFERYSRGSGKDWTSILDACEEGGAKLATPGQVLDPASPEDSFLTDLFAALSRRERRKTVQRSARGRREAVRAGRWNGSAPMGYRVGEDGRLAVDAERAPVIVRIFDRVADGASFSTVANELTAAQVPTATGCTRWSSVSVARIVRCPAYRGDVVFAGTKRGGGEETIEVIDAHPALVSRSTWTRAVTASEVRARAGLPRSRWNSGFLVTGILWCANCGGRLNGTTSRNRRRPGEDRTFRYYLCLATRRGETPPGGRCPRLRGEPVEEAVLAQVAAALACPAVVERVRRELVDEQMRGSTADANVRAELENAIASTDARLRALYADRVAGVISASQFAAWNAEALAEQQARRDELRRLEDRFLALGRAADVQAFVGRLADIGSVLRHLDPTETKQLLGELIAEVRVTGADEAGAPIVAIQWRLAGLAGPASVPPADPVAPLQPEAARPVPAPRGRSTARRSTHAPGQ